MAPVIWFTNDPMLQPGKLGVIFPYFEHFTFQVALNFDGFVNTRPAKDGNGKFGITTTASSIDLNLKN
jgi:hypothetical protein